jgi:hypothetical protein
MRHAAIVIIAFLSAASLDARQATTGAVAPVPQNPQDTRPPRDPKQLKDSGTARIRGRVIGGEAGTPLRRATVLLSGEGTDGPRSAITDDNGRYDFKDLSAGRIRLTASKGGYVEVQYGQRRPQQSGRPIDLGSGQTIEADFNLPRGGVLTGRITDEIGEPAVGASVHAERWQYAGGKRQLQSRGGAATDDMGRFRIYGLAAGDYYVTATMDAPFSVGASDSRVGSCKTFYPGTARQAEAHRLRVTAGGENAAVNFAVQTTRTVQVSGSVLDSNGHPAPIGFVSAMAGDWTMGGPSVAGIIKPDGTFTLSGLNAGDYILFAQAGLGSGPADVEMATSPISVATEDLSGLALTTAPPSQVKGQIIFDGAAPAEATPSLFFLGTRPLVQTSMMFGDGGPLNTKPDWTFEGYLRISPSLIVGGDMRQKWTVKAVLQDGVDVTDAGIQFKPGEAVDNIQVVLSDRTTVVTGAVTTEKNLPTADYVVLLFPDDSAKWAQEWRYVRTERPNQQGRFEVKGLPPGRYLGVALDDLEDGQASDPEYLEQMRRSATAFDLGDGEQKTLALKIVTDHD